MKKYAIAAAICVCMLVLGSAFAQSPGHSKAFGMTLGDWMELYTIWNLGGDQDNPEGKMVFLPNINDVPEDEIGFEWDEDGNLDLWGEMDTTLEPGQKFAMILFTAIGWKYEDGTEDDPDDEFWLAFIKDADIQVWLDGKLIIDSDDEDYEDFWFGPEYFDDPIPGTAPGTGDDIDNIWVQGYGFVHHPLSKGEHTYVSHIYIEDYLGYGFSLDNELTLNITVEK